MPDEVRNTGMRFSLHYQLSGELLPDSQQMRLRISRALFEACGDTKSRIRFKNALTAELGVTSLENSSYVQYWDSYFSGAQLSVVLDAVSVVLPHTAHYRTFLETVRRIFRETRVTYQVDENGGVRFVADEAYEANRASAIRGLLPDRHGAVRANISEVDAAMSEQPPNGRQAIRAVFGAAENLFKQMSTKPRLTRAFLLDEATSWLDRKMDGNDHERQSATKILQSFGQWVEGAHFYRHEAGQPDPHQPSEDLAILMVSQGLSFVRWLAAIDLAQVSKEG